MDIRARQNVLPTSLPGAPRDTVPYIRMARSRAQRVIDPVTEFLRTEASGGLLLLAASIVAMVWINSPVGDGYTDLWEAELTVGFGDLSITEDLRHWVNDGLMAIFFFVISLEIKREMIVGDLRHPRAAALPILAALGGVVLPAAIFIAITAGTGAGGGWGIPMATDAAFAIGVLTLLGDRVSTGAKLFLVTIAVVDDVLAILVIAVVYTADLEPLWLVGAAAGLLVVAAMKRLQIPSPLAYVLPALVVWVATLESGVHPTIAGVALGLMTPAGAVRGRMVLEELEHRIHPFTSNLVLPVFALANAGVVLGGSALGTDSEVRVAAAVAVGLIVGKLVGISAMTWAAVRTGLGRLPEGVGGRTALGVAALGGVGFTVSLFIAPLAYPDAALADSAKIGVLSGSIVSALIGVAILAGVPGRPSARERDAPEPS